MKQKLLFVLTTLLVCCCHLQVRAAEIVAPVDPEWTETAVAPESGRMYYIKRANSSYIYALRSSNGSYGLSYTSDFSNANAFVLTKTVSGWTMCSVTYGLYISDKLGTGNTYASLSESSTSESYWIIDDEASADGHYMMKTELDQYYSETKKYWDAYTGSCFTNAEIRNAAKFVFIDAEVRERYLASKQLYNAILVAQGKNLYVSNFEDFYNNRNNHTVAEIYAKAQELVAASEIASISQVVSPNNETSLVIYPTKGDWKEYKDSEDYGVGSTDNNAVLSVTFKVDAPSSLFWQVSRYYSSSYKPLYIKTGLEVFVDGNKVSYYEIADETITKQSHGGANILGRLFIDVEPGEHTVEFKREGGRLSFYDIGVMQSPLITVSLAEPGSLGTEVLYNVDGLKDVKSLKVIGKMNDDDWAKIAMMDNLMNLDLSQTIITEIPAKALSRNADASFGFLHNVVLPEGLIAIGDQAFDGTYLNTVNIPSTVTTIGSYAFYGTNVKSITMPNSVTSIGLGCFSGCRALREVTLSNNLTSIPSSAFNACENLETCDLPEGIASIEYSAFRYDYKLSQTMPSTLQSIGREAYYYCMQLCGNTNGELVIPENVNNIEKYAFQYCADITSVDLPTKFYAIDDKNENLFANCNNVSKITLRCPTLVTHTYLYNSSNREAILGCDLTKVDLFVPDYLVPNYKLDEYWYNYKTITGIETSKIQDWTINNPLVMSDRGRFLGEPDITINGNKTRMPSLKINGEAPMTIHDLSFGGAYNSYINYPGQILSNCSNVSVTGNVQTSLYTIAKYWYFFSLPFDVKVSEIAHDKDNVQVAIRYYDGANRATEGTGANWKNYDDDAVIPAGTGFIMQTNVDTWNYFQALDNANKQLCVSNAEFVKNLNVNASENASNRGWNLVGNPWQCYYNNHSLNFTAPITVWNTSNRTYSAYSLTDDDYAIRPNEAFFVQCPGAELKTIGFPVGGRQLTDVITTQNAARAMAAARRLLVNVKISNGDTEDQTRVVLNETASMDYELHCDASKMMSMDASVAQIYSLDANDTQYAINERPVGNGIVQLGFYAATDGEYMLSLGRCDAEGVVLIDYAAGTEQSLVSGYTFNARAGYDNGRFALRFNTNVSTGIESVNNEMTIANEPCYNLAGQRVVRGTKGINVIGGRKIVVK